VFPLILVVALLGTHPPSTPPLNPSRIVESFAGSLQGEHPAIAGSAFASGAVRARVAETLERFQCAAIDHYGFEVSEQTSDAATIVVEIDGIGITAIGRRLPLPRRWFLHAVRKDAVWSIDEASTEEQRIAVQLLATPGDAMRKAIIDAHPEYDPAILEIALADTAYGVKANRFGPPQPEQVDRAADATFFAMGQLLFAGDKASVLTGLHIASIFDWKLAEDVRAQAEASGDCDQLAAALFTLGNVRAQQGHEDGVLLLRQVGAMVDQVDDPRLPLKALHNYAFLQQQRGAIPQAFDAALALAGGAARYGWPEGEAAANLDLAEIYVTLNRDDLALPRRRRALDLLRADGNNLLMAPALFELASTEIRLGDDTHGLAHYAEAVALGRTALPHNDLIQSLTAYIRSVIDAGRISEASRAVTEILRFHPDPNDPVIDAAIAAVRLAQRRDRDAIALASIALKDDAGVLQDPFFGDFVWRAETIAGRAHARLGHRRQALAALGRAIDVIETRRAALPADDLARQRYFTARIEPYRALIDVLVAEGRPRAALMATERIKARTLLDLMTYGRANLAHELTAADRARESAAVAEVARRRAAGQSAQRIAEARRSLDELRAALRWIYPAAAIQANDDDFLRALKTLPEDAAVVEYFVEPSATFVFVVRNGRVRVKRLAVSRSVMTREVRALHDALASRRLDYASSARRVARLLLRPIEPWIGSASRVYVVPDGAIWQVPFAILPDAHGDPLVAHRQIACLPSIALVTKPRPSGSTRSLLAMGNPSGSNLPDAAREVNAIASIYGPAVEVYVGSAASGSRFIDRAPAHSVIHIAAHAEVLDDWPMESSLLLSGRSITADEILRTPLRSDMTVLAACDTAAGHVREGEGVLGLSWALLGAGCGNTVVSQWPVDSAATMRLMIAFHRAYAAGLRPAAALRRAELAMRGRPSEAHPFYWAPFIVIASEW